MLEGARAFKHQEGTADIELNAKFIRKDGRSIDSLMKRKTVLLTMLAILLVFPAILLSGCTAGEVVAPFNPKPVKPEPYNPEPPWDPRSDTTLTSIQSFKQQTGQTTAPSGSATGASGTSATTGGTTGGTTTVTPVPGPTPTPSPGTIGRVPLSSDPIHGVVRDRIEGGVIPNARVTLTNRRGTPIASFTTNASGEYSFISLSVGYYRVSVAADGYTTCPLSIVDINYFGIPATVNLELVYERPWQIIEGGNFDSLGNVYYRTEDSNTNEGIPTDASPAQIAPAPSTPISSWTQLGQPGVPDALRLPFYSSATQQTYNAVLFKDVHGDATDLPGNIFLNPDTDHATPPAASPYYQYQFQGSPGSTNLSNYELSKSNYMYDWDTEPWAQYHFFLPAPVGNKYSYDGMWTLLPETWIPDAKNIWTQGGYAVGYYWDWYFGSWVYMGNTEENLAMQPRFSAVEPNTGEVKILIYAKDASREYVVTRVRLDYDYRKDTAAPTFFEQHAVATNTSGPGIDDGSVDFVLKPQEECFATITISGPGGYSDTESEIYYQGIVDLLLGPSNLAAGNYTYTITLRDLPGNSASYGPYSFNII